jgi:hypothetical protein
MIWLSPKGDKIFGANKKIYRAPDYTTETFQLDLPKTGEVDIPRNFIKSIDYNETLECYFMAGSDYWWGTENGATIYQVNKTSFSAEKSVNVSFYPGLPVRPVPSGHGNPLCFQQFGRHPVICVKNVNETWK